MSGLAQSFGIAALCGYVPLLRLDRKAAARELAQAMKPVIAGWASLAGGGANAPATTAAAEAALAA